MLFSASDVQALPADVTSVIRAAGEAGDGDNGRGNGELNVLVPLSSVGKQNSHPNRTVIQTERSCRCALALLANPANASHLNRRLATLLCFVSFHERHYNLTYIRIYSCTSQACWHVNAAKYQGERAQPSNLRGVFASSTACREHELALGSFFHTSEYTEGCRHKAQKKNKRDNKAQRKTNLQKPQRLQIMPS